MIDAGKLIWLNYKAFRWNLRSKRMLRGVLVMQRYFRGGLSRQWMRHCHDAATFIQKFVRKLLVCVVLDKPGRDVARKYAKELHVLIKAKGTKTEFQHEGQCSRIAGQAKLALDKHRNRNVDMRRALSFNLRSKHTRKQDRAKMAANVGRTQPQRITIFEPMVFGLARLQPERLPARIGCKQSRVMKQVNNSQRLLDKSLPAMLSAKDKARHSWVCPFRLIDTNTGMAADICRQSNPMGMRNCASCKQRKYDIPHGATLRGRAAVIAMRLAKQPKMVDKKAPLLSVELCGTWGTNMFDPRSF